jgi:hypothetical protein
VVLVYFYDIAAHAAGDLAQLAFLIGRGLILRADAKVENCTFHAQALQTLGVAIICSVLKINPIYTHQLSYHN